MQKMTHTEFCHWLSGFVSRDRAENTGLSTREWDELQAKFRLTDNEASVSIESSPKAPSAQLTLNLTDGMSIGVRDGAR